MQHKYAQTLKFCLFEKKHKNMFIHLWVRMRRWEKKGKENGKPDLVYACNFITTEFQGSQEESRVQRRKGREEEEEKRGIKEEERETEEDGDL